MAYGMGTLGTIIENNPDKEFLKADGLDDAVIGVDGDILVYSKQKCVKVLMDRDGMTDEDAMEFLEFNTYCAYVGPKTPKFTDEFDEFL